MVTVCAVALQQAQVTETPIDAPTCVERGKPGDLSVGGERSISPVWSASDQEGGKDQNMKAKGETSRGVGRRRRKVRSDNLVCDAGEQASK